MFARLMIVCGALASLPAATLAEDRPPEVVFFGDDRAAFDADGLAVIASAARAALADGSGAVVVTGHADRAGDARYNLDLAARRARAVREDLMARGLSATVVVAETRGEAEPAVATADGQSEAANRRVVLTRTAPGALPAPDPDAPIRFPLP